MTHPLYESDLIAVLTYDAPHRKTEDVVWRLLASGFRALHLVATPWVDRPERKFIYPHRPGEKGWPCEPTSKTAVFAEKVGIPFTTTVGTSLEDTLNSLECEVAVVGGAQLLPESVVTRFKVVNVHPGLLPMCRGLDILKWSVLELLRVGVTAHICDGRADLGRRITERAVPVYAHDTFHSFAMRQYEMENALIPDAVESAMANDKKAFEEIPETFALHGTDIVSESRRRMPRRIEAGLLPAFERYKLVYAI